MRIVIALGGNALSQKGEPMAADVIVGHVQEAAPQLARAAAAHELIITHGNGPQIGFLSLLHDSNPDAATYPLDLLSAEAAGLIGAMIGREIRNAMPELEVVTLLNEVIVAADDPDFLAPSKPIGAVYASRAVAENNHAKGTSFVEVEGGWRRTVASPVPQEIVGLEAIERQIGLRRVVICAGGGGIPVIAAVQANGERLLKGCNAVIDKDLTAAMLAIGLKAERLVILTDMEYVEANWGTPDQEPIKVTDAGRLRQMAFEAGTMGPKIKAALSYIDQSGGSVSIGHLKRADDVIAGRAGTLITA